MCRYYQSQSTNCANRVLTCPTTFGSSGTCTCDGSEVLPNEHRTVSAPSKDSTAAAVITITETPANSQDSSKYTQGKGPIAELPADPNMPDYENGNPENSGASSSILFQSRDLSLMMVVLIMTTLIL